MHIESNIDLSKIERCFSDFAMVQSERGINIQITEFDMCLPEAEIFDEHGNPKKISTEEKDKKIQLMEQIIRKSGVELEGLSYWTSTDILSPDVQRTNTKTFLLKDFYNKFKRLDDKENPMDLQELLSHPFLSKEQAKRFEEMYMQEGGKDALEQLIKTQQRKPILSRGSGLYSEMTKEKEERGEITFQEIGKGTTKSFSLNPERASKVMDSLEYGIKAQEEMKEGQTQEEG